MDENDWLADVYEQLVAMEDKDVPRIVIEGASVRLQRNKILVYHYRRGGRTEIYDWSVIPPRITVGPDVSIPRIFQTMVTLPNGHVAVIGGMSFDKFERLAQCEVFKPARSMFFSIGDMCQSRERAAAVLLRNNFVLVCGGAGGGARTQHLRSCELYDPSTMYFVMSKATMRARRAGHTATLLPDGTVLVAGGVTEDYAVHDSTEIYDPQSDSFSDGPHMLFERAHHKAVALEDGRVFICEADDVKTEMYHPTTRSFSPGPDMLTVRYTVVAFLLPDGRVLITGSEDASSPKNNKTEIFDPVTNRITAGPEITGTNKHEAVLF